MSVFFVNGAKVDFIFDASGVSKNSGYDLQGNLVFHEDSEDYDVWNTDYERVILEARDGWARAYRNNENLVPFILTTDQHTYFDNTAKGRAYGYALYNYLNKAVKWNEISANLNLGDVVGNYYSAGSLNSMLNVLSAVPTSKKINIAGNHDINSTDGTLEHDDEMLDTIFTNYFNNENYSGYSRNGRRGFETMVDAEKHIRYICIGSWDYLPNKVMPNYRISPENISWLIQTLSIQDDNDIVMLSHVQPSAGSIMAFYPPPERDEWRVKYSNGFEAADGQIKLQNLLLARKNKTSGSFVDSDGVEHTFDFSNCTSDFLCSLHGHSHTDWCNWDCGFPAIIFDAYSADNLGHAPFFFGNIDRENQCVTIWKVGRIGSYTSSSPSGIIYSYSIPLNKPELNPMNGVHFPADKKNITIRVGETIRILPEMETDYPNDGSTYPRWLPSSYTVRVDGTVSQRYVSASDKGVDGVDLTGKAAGVSVVKVWAGSFSDTCTVTVVEEEEINES